MIEQEKLIKQFAWGISILTAYLHYNSKENLTDIDILSENFARDLLNTLYDLDLEKAKKRNSPGFDLIDRKNKLVVQVTATCTMQKVLHTIEVIDGIISETNDRRSELERYLDDVDSKKLYLSADQKKAEKERITQEIRDLVDIRGYKVKFFFLCQDTKPLHKRGNNEKTFLSKERISFDLEKDTVCFNDLIHLVNELSFDKDYAKIKRLSNYMERNSSLFIRRESIQLEQNRAEDIVQEYAKNFCEPLFLHKYKPDTRVTLENLFVEPSFMPLDGHENCPKTIIEIFDAFLWGDDRDRLLFIDGDAAIGKTSLVSWLCYHYTKLDEIGKSIFLDIPIVCIRLRDITLLKNESAESCILRYLSFNSIEQFEEHYENALIILEGADELGLLGGIGAISIEQFILNIRHAFHKHKIIVTSRPKFINMGAFSGNMQSFSCRHISLSHFSAEKRARWISNYEESQKCGEIISESTKQYLLELSDKEADGVADTPLALYLLVACEISTPLKNNKWALYHEIFHNAIRNTPYNDSFHIQGDDPSHNALRDEQFAESVYLTIGRIAYKMFQNTKEDRFYILSNELDGIINELGFTNIPERAIAIRKCCVLCAYWKENTSTGALEFYHNDIRDFFMCEYIYRRFFTIEFPSDIETIIRIIIETACEIFQFGVIAQTTWAQTFSFLYYRLQYENTTSNNAFTPEVLHKIKNLFPVLIDTIVNKDILWKYSFLGPHYESVKTSFFNAILFMKIWATALIEEPTESFSADSPYDIWSEEGVFSDWIDVFRNTIEISGKKHIAFGSRTHYLRKDFSQKNLSKACFEESIIDQSSFVGANLSSSLFRGSKISNVDFTNANLSNVDFTNATLIAVNFSSANLSNACFSNAVLRDVVWPQKAICMDKADFSDAHIYNARWKNWKLTNVVFHSTFFENCTLHKFHLFHCTGKISYHNCSITNSIFESVSNLEFSGNQSVLSNVSFRGQINICSFYNLELKNSSWTDAELSNLKFENVLISDAELRGTSVRATIFKKCAFDGSIDLLRAQLSKSVAIYLKEHAKSLVNLSTITIKND